MGPSENNTSSPTRFRLSREVQELVLKEPEVDGLSQRQIDRIYELRGSFRQLFRNLLKREIKFKDKPDTLAKVVEKGQRSLDLLGAQVLQGVQEIREENPDSIRKEARSLLRRTINAFPDGDTGILKKVLGDSYK